ncbi:MAG: hypothetical protein ACOYNL_08660 [Rickettsiales bacterium]
MKQPTLRIPNKPLTITVWAPEAQDAPEVHACLKKIGVPEIRTALGKIASEYQITSMNFVAGERDKPNHSGDMVIRLCIPLSALKYDYYDRMNEISGRVAQLLNAPTDVMVMAGRSIAIPHNSRMASRHKFYQYSEQAKPLELVFDSRQHTMVR